MPTDRPRPARTEAGPTGGAGPGTATRPGPGGDRAATRLPRRVRVMRRLSRELPPPRCGVAWIPRLEVPGADGVTLLADHYVPLADEGRGTILVRTPYGRGFPWAHLYGVAFAEHQFVPGHRLRLQVSGGAFARFARNTGTGEPLATTTRLVSTDIEVYHDQARPSALLLPAEAAG